MNGVCFISGELVKTFHGRWLPGLRAFHVVKRTFSSKAPLLDVWSAIVNINHVYIYIYISNNLYFIMGMIRNRWQFIRSWLNTPPVIARLLQRWFLKHIQPVGASVHQCEGGFIARGQRLVPCGPPMLGSSWSPPLEFKYHPFQDVNHLEMLDFSRFPRGSPSFTTPWLNQHPFLSRSTPPHPCQGTRGPLPRPGRWRRCRCRGFGAQGEGPGRHPGRGCAWVGHEG